MVAAIKSRSISQGLRPSQEIELVIFWVVDCHRSIRKLPATGDQRKIFFFLGVFSSYRGKSAERQNRPSNGCRLAAFLSTGRQHETRAKRYQSCVFPTPPFRRETFWYLTHPATRHLYTVAPLFVSPAISSRYRKFSWRRRNQSASRWSFLNPLPSQNLLRIYESAPRKFEPSTA